MFVLLSMRRHKEIIKNVVLDSPLLVHFLGEQKMNARASAENHKLGLCLPSDRHNAVTPKLQPKTLTHANSCGKIALRNKPIWQIRTFLFVGSTMPIFIHKDWILVKSTSSVFVITGLFLVCQRLVSQQ